MPLRSHASRPSKLSTSDWARRRVRPPPRSSNQSVSSATPSASPSNVKVWTMRAGRPTWKQPGNPYSAPSAIATYRLVPPWRPAAYSTRVAVPSGPALRAHPPGVELGIGVGAEQLVGRRVEVTAHPDDRQLRVGLDGRLGDLAHARPPSSGPGRRRGGGSAPRRAGGGVRSRCPSGRGPRPPGAPAWAGAPAAG